jgi:3-phosphoglycerate kinase
MKALEKFCLKNKKALVRVDFNVPLSERGDITDDFRIKASLSTLKYLIKKKAKVILISHLGRPEGKFVKKYSLKPIVKRLEKLLKRKVRFLADSLGEKVEKEIKKTKAGEVVLLENLRFYKEEEENDKKFAKNLARLADVFINDAFSVCHRAHASVVGITKYLPSTSGFLLEKEIKILSQITKNPKRPLLVIIGGKKITDKAKVVERFSERADFLLVGGLVADEIKKGKIRIKSGKVSFPFEDKESLDIGPQTIEIFKEKIKRTKTVFWAGPLGKIEDKKYQRGTREIARAIIKSGAFSVIGGGNTIEFINKIGLISKFDHVSIGGGAMLKFLAGEKMPGIEALKYVRN